jgi:hypothetical protein
MATGLKPVLTRNRVRTVPGLCEKTGPVFGFRKRFAASAIGGSVFAGAADLLAVRQPSWLTTWRSFAAARRTLGKMPNPIGCAANLPDRSDHAVQAKWPEEGRANAASAFWSEARMPGHRTRPDGVSPEPLPPRLDLLGDLPPLYGHSASSRLTRGDGDGERP